MASKRKLSTAAFGFEDDEERAKRISHRVASEKRSKDSEEGYRPQSPKMPDPDGEVKHALAGALEQKIWWQGGGWLPPGMDVHLAEAEKEEVSRKTTKDYNNSVLAYHRKRRWTALKAEAAGQTSQSKTTKVAKEEETQGQASDTGKSDPLFASLPQSLLGRKSTTCATLLNEELHSSGYIFETTPPPRKGCHIDSKTVTSDIGGIERSKQFFPLPSYARRPAGKSRPVWQFSTQPANGAIPRIEPPVSMTGAKSTEIDKAAEQRPAQSRSGSQKTERYVHLQNQRDVLDLIALVKRAMDSIEKSPHADSARVGRDFRCLGWQLALLKRQLDVLLRINEPDYHPCLHRLPDLIKHKVANSFPFRTPVRVDLYYTNVRLQDDDIKKICLAFTLTTYDGICECIDWLEYQAEDLRTSPLHWQPKSKYQKESAFLERTINLLEAMRERIYTVPPPLPAESWGKVDEATNAAKSISSADAGQNTPKSAASSESWGYSELSTPTLSPRSHTADSDDGSYSPYSTGTGSGLEELSDSAHESENDDEIKDEQSTSSMEHVVIGEEDESVKEEQSSVAKQDEQKLVSKTEPSSPVETHEDDYKDDNNAVQDLNVCEGEPGQDGDECQQADQAAGTEGNGSAEKTGSERGAGDKEGHASTKGNTVGKEEDAGTGADVGTEEDVVDDAGAEDDSGSEDGEIVARDSATT